MKAVLFYRVKIGIFNEHWFGTITRKKEKFELCLMVAALFLNNTVLNQHVEH